MSLPTRIVLAFALVLALVVLLGGVLGYRHGVKRVDVETAAALSRAEATLRALVDEAAAANEPDRDLKRVLDVVDQSRHFSVSIIDRDGWSETRVAKQRDHSAPRWFHALFVPARNAVEIALPPAFTRLGAIRLQSEPDAEIAELWSDFRLLATIVTGTVTLLLASIFMLLNSALSPLPRLIDAFARVGEGDYGVSVAAAGPREFRRLCNRFNHMTERLAAAERANVRLTEELTRVQEMERADLARDLHDGLGPLLFAIDVDAMSIEQLDEKAPIAEAKSRLGSIRLSTAGMKSHVGLLLGRLRPDVALDLGLAHAVKVLVEACQPRHPEVAITYAADIDSAGGTVDATLYAVVREALNNALRHARARSISIRISRTADGGVTVAVEDDGVGIQLPRTSTGYGLIGMRERMGAVGGTLEIGPRREAPGTRVAASVPAAGIVAAQETAA